MEIEWKRVAPVTPLPLKETGTVGSSGSFDGMLSVVDLAPVDVGLKTT